MSKQSLTFVEIDIPYCSRTYGVAPCAATLTGPSPTGIAKCFNSIATCQDRAHFNETTVTLRFAMPADYLVESGIDAIPSLASEPKLDPAIISLGENLGVRASLTVTFKDHRWSDTGPGYDKYRTERVYDPFKMGTYWGKFRARQPFLRGRSIRLIRGFVGQTLAEMDTRHYVIESTNGPNPQGTFTVMAKDVLKLADGDRAQAPRLSNGFLVANITATATTATLTPSGIGNAEYPTSGIAAIGGTEIVNFTRSSDTLTLTRARFNTVGVAHASQDRVQLCLYYESDDPADIIDDLLINYAGVDVAQIPIDQWRDETENYLRRVYTALIAEPTSVNKLCSELIEQAALAMWWADRSQQVRLQVLREVQIESQLLDETSYLEGSMTWKEQPAKRISQVWVYFGLINPLEGIDDPSNYRSNEVVIDTNAEIDNGSPAIKKIFSRWIPAFGRTVATRAAELQLARYSRAPRRFNFDLFRSANPVLGQGYRIVGQSIQTDQGERETVRIQIVSIEPTAEGYRIEAEENRTGAIEEEDLTNRTIIIDGNANNLNLRAIHDTLFPDLITGDQVTFIINEGVIIGSTSTSGRAIDVGSWPSGIVPKLFNYGRIAGAGGNGGQGKNDDNNTGGTGGAGGPALYLRSPIVRGGGGGDYTGAFGPQVNGGGGGGGAGQIAGAGNSGGSGAQPGNAGTLTAGGTGGNSSRNNNKGGTGGAPGAAGAQASGVFRGQGGAAGRSIDGVSFVTTTGWTGSYLGPTAN